MNKARERFLMVCAEALAFHHLDYRLNLLGDSRTKRGR